MPKFALSEPLTAMWYAKPPGATIFSVGPWPSLEDALSEHGSCDSRFGEADKSGAPGIFEFGLLQPWDARLDAEKLIYGLARDAGETGEPGRKWASSMIQIATRDLGEGVRLWHQLQDAMSLALGGWLARHGLFPHFGHVHDVHRYRWCHETHAWRELCNGNRGDCGQWLGHLGDCRPWTDQEPEAATPPPGCHKVKGGVRCIWHSVATRVHQCRFSCDGRDSGDIMARHCQLEIDHEGGHVFHCEGPTDNGPCELAVGHDGPCWCEDVPF